MAGFIRSKQAGIQNDLSAGLTPEHVAIDDIERYGINSQIGAIAYDPVQSLLAVGTKDSKFGPGQIYIFGRGRVAVTFDLPQRASVKQIQFCADKLVCLDSKNDLSFYSLESKKLIGSHSPPGVATTIATDPALDYALIGMQSGDVLAYDMDREGAAPFRIPNLWAERDPRVRVSPVVSIQFHPRDIGKLLIGYVHGAVTFSFKLNQAQRFFQYEVPAGAPGGHADPDTSRTPRWPKLTQAVWHPTGTFILTGHEDSSMVFWDPKDGRIILARTTSETHINIPGKGATTLGPTVSVKEPIFKVAWCANKDPDDTALLIAGGADTTMPTKGMTFFEMGRTPNYATSSWDVLADHLESPRRQRVLPTPPNAEVVDFCLIPKESPHFAGAQDPIAILALLSSGEVISLSFPSGIPITPTNQLHVSMTFVHPFIRRANITTVDRVRWLGMTENRNQGPRILKGGVEQTHPLKRYENRNIIQTMHADGTVRLWDAGHGDELENDKVLEAGVGRAVGRIEGVDITATSLASASGEFAAGTRSGEVAVFRWGNNRNFGRDVPPSAGGNRPNALTNIIDRADPNLKEGLCPFTLLDLQSGPITSVKVSEVGFVATASEGGKLAVIDMRGPAIIHLGTTQEFGKGEKLGTLRRKSSHAPDKPEWVTRLEFSVMTLEDENYSSVNLHAGTNLGRLATFKLVPDSSGRYVVEFKGVTTFDGRIIHISPVDTHTGRPASANQNAVANLRNGAKTDGVLVAVTTSEARIFRPATAKGAHKTFDSHSCESAAVVRFQDQGYVLAGLFGDGTVRAYTLPALRELNSINISHILDTRRFADSIIVPNGDIFGWTGPSEMALINMWGTGQLLPKSLDKLFNPEALIPPRPTISNFQWVAGTQYVTPSDMDLLIGGPSRPPSKRMLAQSRADEAALRASSRNPTTSASSAAQQSTESWGAYMQRQVQERTQNLSIMGDSMENLEQNSQGWADDVGKFVNKQKRGVVTGLIKHKFGF
ncbi:snare-dependent exocytosis protein-like protein [Aureobasidium subglaciale]|nr:snare-dependent exocytosis protein-like protein [Aureobasidium subglaciale]